MYLMTKLNKGEKEKKKKEKESYVTICSSFLTFFPSNQESQITF